MDLTDQGLVGHPASPHTMCIFQYTLSRTQRRRRQHREKQVQLQLQVATQPLQPCCAHQRSLLLLCNPLLAECGLLHRQEAGPGRQRCYQ